MTKGGKLDGGTDLLAKAMRQVFTEAVEEGTQPVKDAVDRSKQDASSSEEDRTCPSSR